MPGLQRQSSQEGGLIVTFQIPVILFAKLAVIRKSLYSGVLPN